MPERSTPGERLRLSRRAFLRWLAALGVGLVLEGAGGTATAASSGTGVPVLAYHPTFSADWTVEAFREQMRILHELDLRTITFRALRWHLDLRAGGPPQGRVIISVDDIGAAKACCNREGQLAGPYANFWQLMFPEFRRYGFQAVLGVVTADIPEEADGWDWRKIRFLQSLGYELASHSVSHSYEMVGRNGSLTREQALREFVDSKAAIQKNCGIEPIGYVWPFNAVNFKEDAAVLYPVLITYGEGGPVRRSEQLSAVPRYHAELHQGADFRAMMERYSAIPERSHLNPRTRRGELLYVVQPGDSLGRIAARHGTTVAAIVGANRYRYPDLGGGVLQIDMRLLIPTGRVHRGGP